MVLVSGCFLERGRQGAGQGLFAGAGKRSDQFVRGVRLLDVGNIIFRKLNVQRGDGIIHAFRLRTAHDRCSHTLGPVPCKRNLSHGHSVVFGYFKHTFDDGHVLGLRLIILVAHGAVSGAAGGIRIPCRACQMSGSHRRVGRQSNVVLLAYGDELAFVFAVEQIVVALHAGESGPPIGVGHGLQVVELIRIHFAGAQCAYFACFD